MPSTWVTWLATPPVEVPDGFSAAVAVAVGVLAAFIAADYVLRRWVRDVWEVERRPSDAPSLNAAPTCNRRRPRTKRHRSEATCAGSRPRRPCR